MDQAGVVIGRAPVALSPGTTIAGKYRVEKELGRGGFGIVVRATHLALKTPVAIKVLTEGSGTPQEWAEDAERFRREAQATAGLRGENIVRILDVDVLPSGCPYMVMEYLEGETLHNLIHGRGGVSVTDAVDILLQVLAALAEAHAAGIVHRDLKPANVFLARSKGGVPVVKVLDFGVSKMGAGGAERPITRTGAVIGTVLYMAPEQMMDAKRVDARADLWSAGVMLFEMLTRQTPFGPINAPNLVASMLTKPPALLSSFRNDVPRPLEEALMRTLEKAPERRFQSASQLGAALAWFASPRASQAIETLRRIPPPSGAATPLSIPAPTPASMHRGSIPPPRTAPVDLRTERIGRFVIIGLGAAALVFALIALVSLVVSRRTRAPDPETTEAPADPQTR